MWHGRSVTTGIFKEPVEGRVPMRKLNLDGDRQADLSVHGVEHEAVYCYPLAHYDYWKRELPGRDLPMAMFGENFTRTACWNAQSILAISSLLVRQKWLSRSLASLVTNLVCDFSLTT
jgi:MOSC domain-containing protein YiiM